MLQKSIEINERRVKLAILPEDYDDNKNVILEIRSGTGGEEASLFASDLYKMYQRYSHHNDWKFEIMNIAHTGVGGFKEASASISGKNVFSKMKFEAGVHRVQRVPETESSGRFTHFSSHSCRHARSR